MNVVQVSRVVKVVLTRYGRKRESGLGHLPGVERVEKEVRPRPSIRCGRESDGRKKGRKDVRPRPSTRYGRRKKGRKKVRPKPSTRRGRRNKGRKRRQLEAIYQLWKEVMWKEVKTPKPPNTPNTPKRSTEL